MKLVQDSLKAQYELRKKIKHIKIKKEKLKNTLSKMLEAAAKFAESIETASPLATRRRVDQVLPRRHRKLCIAGVYKV